MMLQIPSSADLAHYSPDKGLKVIVTATAAERYWAQAKDSRQLFQAVKAKLLAQAEYVCWRDSVVHHGGDHKSGSRLQPCNLDLPKADPGAAQISRWRSRLCVKTATGTKIDGTKLRDRARTCANPVCTDLRRWQTGAWLTRDRNIRAKHPARIC
jgi:hypothetical protein